MTLLFWILATLMALAALAFVLPPLLRAGGETEADRKRHALESARAAGVLDEAEYRAKIAALPTASNAVRSSRTLPVVLALVLPLAALLLYREVGEPAALDPVARAPMPGPRLADGGGAAQTGEPPSMEQAVSGLAEKLKGEPDNLEGWMLLGRAYKAMERFAPAREALANAYRLAPEDPDVLVEFAEAQALASEARRIDGEPLGMIQQALARQPDHQRGLWLFGIAALQGGDPTTAIATWERLLPLLEGEARDSLLEQLERARSEAGLPPGDPVAAAPSAAVTPPAATSRAAVAERATTMDGAVDAPRLTVQVDIDPALKSRVGASDVLFVYARAPEGPRMPLAIQRLSASQLPISVVLDDSTSMLPDFKLSTLPEVVVGARISRSGLATPQSGDLEALSGTVSSRGRAPLSLVIDRVVP